MRWLLQATCVCVQWHVHVCACSVCAHVCMCRVVLEGPCLGRGRACWGVGLNGPSHRPRGWTAQHLHPQAASILPPTLGNVVSRVRVCYSGYRVWLAMASVATAASWTPAGPASTLACSSALSAQASTGDLPDWVGWGRAKPGGAANLTQPWLLAVQESGCPLLQGSVPDTGFLGARAAKGGGALEVLGPWGGWAWGVRERGLTSTHCSCQLMCELGNSTMNQIYEAQCEGLGSRKPTASSPR